MTDAQNVAAKSFQSHTTRGTWSQSNDFIFAALGFAFKLDLLSITWHYFEKMGIASIIALFSCTTLYVLPLLIIQSFMGQFSSSSFITALRLSPIFKVLGYVSLALNFLSLSFYSLFVIIPLIFLLRSLHTTLPWSCDGYQYWSHALAEHDRQNLMFEKTCNLTNLGPKIELSLSAFDALVIYRIPSMVFLRTQLNNIVLFIGDHIPSNISWSLLAYNACFWCCIAVLLCAFFNPEKLGKLLRFSVGLTLALLLICATRFAFLPGALRKMQQTFYADKRYPIVDSTIIPIYLIATFGASCGSIVTFASFNKFKSNILRQSWLIVVGQVVVFIGFGVVTTMLQSYYAHIATPKPYTLLEQHWILYFTSGSAIATMELPQMWTLLYFGMLTLAGFSFMLIKAHEMLMNFFDEFTNLRTHRIKFTCAFIACLAACSFIFCGTNHGISYSLAFSIQSVLTQIALNLLLIVLVLCIYGRVRFQRDFEFMLGQPFAAWKTRIWLFFVFAYFLFILNIGIAFALAGEWYKAGMLQNAALGFIVLPLLCIACYISLRLLLMTGALSVRLRICFQPRDWLPVDAATQQLYDEVLKSAQIAEEERNACENAPEEVF